MCSESTGKNGGAGARGTAHEQAACANQTFLVGERDGRAAFDGRQCRLQSDRAADRRHHPVGRALRRLDQRVFACRRFDAETGERVFEFAIGGRIGDHGMARADLARDFAKRCRVTPRADGLDAIAFAVRA